MTSTVTEQKIYSAEEYLALELNSERRSEYRHGEIVPMTGGTPPHNAITGALYALLWISLRGKPYRVFVTDQRLWIPECDLYTYPDVMVTANPLQLQPGCKDTIVNPILIAEVLSDSTKAYDRDEKFAAYRAIETFQEYLLIDQTQLHVEQYVKQGANQWLFTEYKGKDGQFLLASVGVEINLIDLYENVEF
jgi:Uma2 family endonuclease